MVRQGDDAWFNIVRWSLLAMIEAEFLGIDSASVDQAKAGGGPAQKRLMGSEGDAGKKLRPLGPSGPTTSFSRSAITPRASSATWAQGSPLKIARGLNAQWNEGGIMYSSPVR